MNNINKRNHLNEIKAYDSNGGPYFVDNISPNDTDLSLLFERSTLRRYPSGRVIFLEGDEARDFYYIKNGRVKISIVNLEGQEKILTIHESDTFIGEHIIDHPVYASTSTTLMESDLYCIELKVFQALAMQHPGLGLTMFRYAEKKMRFLALQISDLCFLSAHGRVAHALLDLARRAGRKTAEGVMIPEKMTHETLAKLTGLSRPTVTLILKDLENLNAIKKQRESILIIDGESLAEMLTT
jgi:CRP/FNR family transcriptional regulator, cyclic AMP receptor protein